MADHIHHIFFKTPKVLDKYDISEITITPPFDETQDFIQYQSRWDIMTRYLTGLFEVLNFSCLEFLLNGFVKGYSRMELEDTQIIFSKNEQIQVVKDIEELFSKILLTENQYEDELEIYTISDYQIFIRRSLEMRNEELEQDFFADANKDMADYLIYFIERIKRFFQASIEHNMTVIKYAY